jgi:hypothetical protein
MSALETTRARVTRVTSNSGHVRLFWVVAVVWWIAGAVWLIAQPVPLAPRQPYLIDNQTVIACADVVLDHQQCEEREDAVTGTRVTIERIGVILLAPFALPMLAFLLIFVFDWIKDGYSRKPD